MYGPKSIKTLISCTYLKKHKSKEFIILLNWKKAQKSMQVAEIKLQIVVF